MKIYTRTALITSFALTFAGSVYAASAISCPVVTSIMKAGTPNVPAEVVKLQDFLRANEGLDVDVNGIYDAKTVAAVHAFQRKYMNEIMGPWGATRTTGVVSVTTGKKINQLACDVPLSLDQKDMNFITKYRGDAGAAVAASVTVSASGSADVDTDAGLVTGSADATAATQDEDDPGYAIDASAALGGGTMMSRFWNYFADLFR